MSVAPTYPLRVAAEAAQIPTIRIRRYIDANVTPIRTNDVKAAGSGSRVGLSRNRILQIAITEALLKSGVSLSTAAKAAYEFSDRGNAGRGAGQLWLLGKTASGLRQGGNTCPQQATGTLSWETWLQQHE